MTNSKWQRNVCIFFCMLKLIIFVGETSFYSLQINSTSQEGLHQAQRDTLNKIHSN